ncbi:hypothetical protein NMV19_11685 [Pasteurella multocida]|uniref:Helix-hairpin-helix domain-containing protein n=1 Tax=Pasteurella multocida TaxID=747 RepID=A0AAW8VAI0_PASMD|nr:hypothetical protein [Pasteurella multocida]MDT3453347.1 hypothetical protein [Pasteurella multocida]MDY0434000.1 hypothetical protein [Pasteurella multocida]MDY0440526.1 hypothetical protein [Pasteurella multocida]MDY0444758.1 hypothetical protein [Pasteurella multocida]MDY0449246.1 hypothetical protein [Pasteurella multocida]
MVTALIIFFIVVGIAWHFSQKKKSLQKDNILNENEIYPEIKISITTESNYSNNKNYEQYENIDDISYKKYPFKKIFIANTFLDTPLKFLEQHGQIIEISTEKQDQETSGFTHYGHWSEIHEYTSNFLMSNVKSQLLSVKILKEIRSQYEKSSNYELSYNEIKRICNENRNSQLIIFNSSNQEIADYYYPSVLSFALGIKRNQVDSLQQFGVYTLEDLEKRTDKEILSVPNIGKKTLTALRAFQLTTKIPKNIIRIPRDEEYWHYHSNNKIHN